MELAKHWRLKPQRYRLEAVRNRQTGAVAFPPPPLPHPDNEFFTLSGKGEVWSFTEIQQGADDFGRPYLIAMIKLVEGPLVTAQLTDVDAAEVAIGQPVEAVTRKLRDLGPDGLIIYGYKFRPILGGE